LFRFLRPETRLNVVIDTAKEEVSQLTQKGVVIVWGGTNDVGENAPRNGLKLTNNLVKNSN
jgi:hypothetical protein